MKLRKNKIKVISGILSFLLILLSSFLIIYCDKKVGATSSYGYLYEEINFRTDSVTYFVVNPTTSTSEYTGYPNVLWSYDYDNIIPGEDSQKLLDFNVSGVATYFVPNNQFSYQLVGAEDFTKCLLIIEYNGPQDELSLGAITLKKQANGRFSLDFKASSRIILDTDFSQNVNEFNWFIYSRKLIVKRTTTEENMQIYVENEIIPGILEGLLSNLIEENYISGLAACTPDACNPEQVRNEVEQSYQSNITRWIWALFSGINGFLAIQIGDISLGLIILIPLAITLAWFIVRSLRGGGSG